MEERISNRKGADEALSETGLLSRFFEAGFVLFCVFSADGTFLRINRLWEELFGYVPSDLIGRNLADFTYKKDVEATKKAISELSETRQASEFVNRFKCRDGGYRQMEWQVMCFDGLLYACVQEVTPFAAKDMRKMQQAAEFESMLDSIPEAVFYKDLEGVYLGCNSLYADVLGIDRREVVGKTDYDMFDPERAASIREIDRRILATRQTIRSEGWYDFSNGIKTMRESIKAPYVDANGTVVGIIGISRDITESKRWENEIQYLSFHDQLTGLYNRRFYEEELKRIDVERNLPITIVMADVDSLKFINDAFGHEEGDNLIRHTARAIKSSCRTEDIVARVGGDEFAVVLPHTDTKTSRKVLSRINALISREKVGMIEVSVSFGAATKSQKGQEIHEVIKKAEDIMYRNKLTRKAETRTNAINNIISALFEKCQREMEHSKRVGVLCEAIAVRMGLDRDTVGKVRLAGIMHDIGKVDIDDSILNKKEKLSPYERETVNNHPELGYRILSTSKEFSDIAMYVGQHHENWDGGGYPKGLKAEQILLPARIIAVAEAYDAMAYPLYEKPRGRAKIVAELRRCAGNEFDPGVVETFVEKVLPDPALDL